MFQSWSISTLAYPQLLFQCCSISTFVYPQQCLHPVFCRSNHCLSLHLLQCIDNSQNSTGMSTGCQSKYHAKWQWLWQYSCVIGIGGTNPQHISHISSFRSLNNSLISWFQFPFLQRLHWLEYLQNLLSYLSLQIASQCSFVIGLAYSRKGNKTKIYVYLRIITKSKGVDIIFMRIWTIYIWSCLPSSSSKTGLPSANTTHKICNMNNREMLKRCVRKQYISDVVIDQNSCNLPCCNLFQETTF